MDIKMFENRSDEYWLLMGKFFASKEVKKELPYMYDEPKKVWFIMVDNNIVIGFCSLMESKNKIIMGNGYIIPSNRNKGHYKELFDHRLRYIKKRFSKKTIISVVKKEMIDIFIDNGFIKTKESKNYVWVILNEPEN